MHKQRGFQFTIDDFSKIGIDQKKNFYEKRNELNYFFMKEYLHDCNARLSPTTVRGYENTLRIFIKFLGATPLVNATLNDVRRFLNDLKKNKRSRGTIKSRFTALISFYKYVKTFHNRRVPKLDDIDLRDYPMSRWEAKGQNPLTRHEVRALLEAPDNLRDALIITFIYYTGQRANEIATCKLENIDTEGRVIQVIGKGNKPRRMPYPAKLDRALNYWINVERKSYVNASGPYLFPSKHGEHLTPIAIYKIVCRAAEKAGIQEVIGYRADGRKILKVHPHILRHSFARHSIDDGIPLTNVQKMMGHERVDTTIHYAGEIGVFKPYYDKFKGV